MSCDGDQRSEYRARRRSDAVGAAHSGGSSGDSGQSALEFVLGDMATVRRPRDFLTVTRRMHRMCVDSFGCGL